MKILSRTLVYLSMGVSASALAGVEIGVPLVSGDVATFENRQEMSDQDLSPAQLRDLAKWLEKHRSDWHGMLAPASMQPGVLQISFKDAAGKAGSLTLRVSDGGDYYLQFISSSSNWSYQSFGGLFKSWSASLPLSSADLNLLRRAVASP